MTRPTSATVAAVWAVLVAASIAPVSVLWLAPRFGWDPTAFQGSSFQVTPGTLAVLLAVAAVSCAIPWAMARWVHRAPLTLTPRTADASRFTAALALGAALAATAQVARWAFTTDFTLVWSVPSDVAWTTFVGGYALFLLAILLLNSIKEEVLFRAYPLQVLAGWGSPGRARVLAALLFAATHMILEPPTASGFVFRFGFGLLAGEVYQQHRSVWAAVGLHTGWNWVAGSISDNWRMGGLWTVQGTPSAFADWCSAAVLLTVIAVSTTTRSKRRSAQ